MTNFFIGKSTGDNGKTVEYKDLAGDLSGQPEQKQAYNFSVIVFCSPVASNFVGDWELVMSDSYGDGWNGGYILATIDGKESKYFADDDSTTVTVTIPSGTTSLVWSYTRGSWEEENSFTITDPSGNSFGPFDGGGSGIPFCFLQ